MTRILSAQNGVAIAILAALLLVPIFSPAALDGLGVDTRHLFTTIFVFAALATAWNITGGFAGQLSLGHAIFYGIGGYTSFLLMNTYGLTPWVGMLVGAALAALVGVAISAPCFRLRGPFFTLSTIAFLIVIERVAINWTDLTGGSAGLSPDLNPVDAQGNRLLTAAGEEYSRTGLTWMTFNKAEFGDNYQVYYLVIAFVILLVCLAASLWVRHSRFGYYLVAVREREDAARAAGVNPFNQKLYAVALSAALASLVGSFHASYLGYAEPEAQFSLQLSVNIALFGLIGGLGTVSGPLVGTILVVPLAEVLRASLLRLDFKERAEGIRDITALQEKIAAAVQQSGEALTQSLQSLRRDAFSIANSLPQEHEALETQIKDAARDLRALERADTPPTADQLQPVLDRIQAGADQARDLIAGSSESLTLALDWLVVYPEAIHGFVYGLVLVVIVLTMPDGVVGRLGPLVQRFIFLRKPVAVEATGGMKPGLAAVDDSHRPSIGGPMLKAENLVKRFGGLVATNNVTMHLNQGEVLGIIGPNGAGKTTLFNQLSGFLRPNEGKVSLLREGQWVSPSAPSDYAQMGVGRTFQIVQPFAEMTVLENIMVGAFRTTASVEEASRAAAEVARLTGLDELLHARASSLTIGGMKRLEVARVLALKPRILLLDEVMAGLAPADVNDAVSMIRGIRDSGVSIIAIEHNMHAIMALSDRIVVINSGEVIAEGTPQDIASNPTVIEAYLGEEYVHAQAG